MSFLRPIIFNWRAKKIAHKILQTPVIAQNWLYKAFYKHKVYVDMSKYEKRPLRVRLGNTNICGEKCSFCPHKDMKRKQGIMSMYLFKKLASQCAEWGVPEVVIQEFGEPFKDPLFFERVQYAYKVGIPKIQTNSNSKFITKDIAKRIMDSNLTELFISCNEKGWKNVEYLSTLTKPKHLKIYLSGIEGYYIPKKLKNIDGVSISFTHNWAGKRITEHTTLNRDPCKLLWATMYITWTGKLALCCMDIEAKMMVGNAKITPLKELWQGDEYKAWRWYHGQHIFPKLCKDCSYNRHDKYNWWL